MPRPAFAVEGTSVAWLRRMAPACARTACVVLVTLLIGSCAHRVRLAAPAGSSATKSAGAAAGGTKEISDAIGKVRESLRRNKRPAPAEEPASPSAVQSPELQPGIQPVGTTGKWVVTTTTERENPQVTSSTTQTAQRSSPKLVSQAVRRGWPLLLAGLAVLACLVVLTRSLRRSAENS
jgi:hypothetical protein